MEDAVRAERRELYSWAFDALGYARSASASGDVDGEAMVLKHVCELVLELIATSAAMAGGGASGEEGDEDALELHGVPEMW